MNLWHKFQVRAVLRYEVQTAGWLILNIAAARCGGQRLLQEKLTNNLDIPFPEQCAPDRSARFHGIPVPAGQLAISYELTVERSDETFSGAWSPWEANLVELPSAVAPYLYPSRYCESDKLTRFAAKEFGHLSLGHSRVAAICNWIHEKIDYLPGVTNEHSSAVDCLTSRAGVCRDFAHLGIAFCRALGVPARYASAYVFQMPSPDFHACFEVWLGDRWWYYDATRLAPQAGFILIGTGHDAADTSIATMSMGVQFCSMEITVDKISHAPVEFTTSPISFRVPQESEQQIVV
jgi:transglutaminase-like putative cysteine protease